MADFWSRLGSSTPESSPRSTDQQPPPTGQAWWQVSVPQTPAPQQPPEPLPDAAQEPDAEAQSRDRAQWAKQPAQSCPSCSSSNYLAHPDQPTVRARCYDCGYPVSQSGSGLRLRTEASGPVQEARQTAASKTNDFNPQNVFHTLG
ncbi:hypothetical protein [Streptomyces tubercidicus]|uniref:hypothetical protein n=1 Tax=Streptomyces tubercidicus TaxID=47759 RepID=UPI0036844512